MLSTFHMPTDHLQCLLESQEFFYYFLMEYIYEYKDETIY